MCTAAAMVTSVIVVSTCTRRSEPVDLMVLRAELEPTVTDPGVPSSSDTCAAPALPSLPSASAVAAAFNGVTTTGPDPIALPPASALSRWRRG